MYMMSTFLTKEEKDKIRPVRLSEARQYHKDLIERLGISPNDFNIKVPWKDRYGRDCVLLFDSEFLKEKGFYFEMADSNLNFHEDRKVYKVSRNTNYKDEYEKYESIYNGEVKVKYIVPFEELRPIDAQSVYITKGAAISSSEEILAENRKKTFTSPVNTVTLEDAPYMEMTIRDYMAIQTGKPVSLKRWLNELIKSSK